MTEQQAVKLADALQKAYELATKLTATPQATKLEEQTIAAVGKVISRALDCDAPRRW